MATTEEEKVVPTYKVDTNDSRLTGITNEKDTEILDSDNLYNDQIDEVDSYVEDQTKALDDWEAEQKKIQNEQTEFTIDKIEQNRENAKKDYIKEQSGAYVDWQKQSSQHGANAEAMAARGMGQTGYSESSQVSMYNTYQNRVATAREAFIRADTEFKNDINAARLANSSALAQIAFEALQKKLEISFTGFQYKNTLIQSMAQARREISQDYWTRYNAMYGNIHNENVLNESARHNKVAEENAAAQLQLERDEFDYQKEQDSKKPLTGSVVSGGSGGSGGGSGEGSTNGGKILKSAKTLDSSKVGKKSLKQPTVDQKSVLALGFGPIGPSKLNSLISEGKVVEYEKNGKLKYKKVFNYSK